MSFVEPIIDFIVATLRLSTPLIMAALGGFLSERSGVTNIALEGKMLLGAFMAGVFAAATQDPWIGVLAAMIGSGILAAFYAFFVLKINANQCVTATAINMLAAGIAPFVCKLIYGNTGGTPTLEPTARFSHHEPMMLAFITLVFLVVWFRRCRGGLWLRFAGEHPEALETAGISVFAVRFWAVTMSGVLAGIGGAGLALYQSSSFTRDMSAGRGFMALAALIMGKWMPLPTAAACLLFGAVSAMEIRLQGVILWGTSPVPVQFIQILPYVLTVLILIGAVGRSRAPAALGFQRVRS